MSSGGIIRLSNPELDAQIAALTSQQGTLTGTQSTISTNLAALIAQVQTLAPDNVIQNGEFTAQAVLELIKTVHGADSLLDADLLDGHEWQEVIDLIAAADPMAAIAAANVGVVGSYAFLRRESVGGIISPGSNYAGSSLSFTGIMMKPTVGNMLRSSDSGFSPSGTWKAMGDFPSFSSSSYPGHYAASLFLRIS